MAASTPPPQPNPPLPEITDIASPVDIFPWPPWVAVVAATAILVVLGIIGWLILRAVRRRVVPPLSPRAHAMRELEALRAEVDRLDPYQFSVRVSDILRLYIEGQFGLRAMEQTSQEFLASLSGTQHFGLEDQALLGRFLEKCDLIKFARIDSTSEDSAALLRSAMAFAQGGEA